MSYVISQEGVTIVELGEQYDSLNVETIQQIRDLLLKQAAEAEPPLLVLDFSRTKLIGSSLIEVLFRTWKRLLDRNGTMALCKLNFFCNEVVQVCRLDTIWDIFATREEAIRYLTSSSSS